MVNSEIPDGGSSCVFAAAQGFCERDDSHLDKNAFMHSGSSAAFPGRRTSNVTRDFGLRSKGAAAALIV